MMSLLQEIQDAAIDSHADLSTLLRKCRVLAARLKNDEFKSWVQHELDGYPDGTPVPDYRVCQCQSQGHFSGPFGSGLRDAPIPTMCIPEKLREVMTKVEFRQGVTSLRDTVDKSDGSSLRVLWPNDLVALMGQDLYERMNMLQAWRIIPVSAIIRVLGTVRNRILSFALEIESEDPDAGESRTSTPSLSSEKIGNVFNTYITGNVGNVASGSSDFSQEATVSVMQNDLASLRSFLQSLEVDDSDIGELEEAIKADPEPQPKKGFGPCVSAWFGKMVAKSAQGLWKVGTSVASNILTKALAEYYGLGA
jgi:hypothetical protein